MSYLRIYFYSSNPSLFSPTCLIKISNYIAFYPNNYEAVPVAIALFLAILKSLSLATE